ncbi:MAG: hypothetical protein NC293_05805 [Roseburia sp.]|nr:hypothetical protein [Roseburia sp.]
MSENNTQQAIDICNKECTNSGNTEGKEACQRCYISTESSNHTRRCFMSGEYCSQKTNIQRERKKLYEKGDGEIVISAFVIMNFSDMSDVVYKWRIEKFIESLNKYLYVDSEKKRLYCNIEKNDIPEGMEKVDKIKVVRADSNPSSNYVICSRICQQMQIADLVIVDVSTQNPNVFYEFGMAVALEKLILPICFSESFYKSEYPKEIKEMDIKNLDQLEELEKHIGCYPWRKKLFEYYGIRFKQNEKNDNSSNTSYLEFEKAANRLYGFSDKQYGRFPYDERLGSNESNIGEIIYGRLMKEYNNATKDDNTLVVYTIEGFLNKDQAGRCIVNFYRSITERMKKEQCFCGERVGVLVQGNVIPDSDKDAQKERHVLYNAGEIIHIGVNQATYLAAKEKIRTEDIAKLFSELSEIENFGKTHKQEIEYFVKEYIGNRGMILYPDNPVYVERVKNQITPDVLKKDSEEEAFCLYHVMLRTLCYTNEIVVDITNNSPQSLFWLGAAHGAEVYAITVKNELTEKERKIVEGDIQGNSRNVFDVAGLWTAYYYSHDTEGFYHQLALAQFGIEKHSKIIPFDTDWHGFKKWEYLELHESGENGESTSERKLKEDGKENQIKDWLALESYYRRKFWNTMLRYNRLRIYLPQHSDNNDAEMGAMSRITNWDLDAVSALSYYLSKRSVIGEYVLISLPDGVEDRVAEDVNFICVGQPVKPLTKKVTEYIFDRCKESSVAKMGNDSHINKIHEYKNEYIDCDKCGHYNNVQVRGFVCKNEADLVSEKGVYSYLTRSFCKTCNKVVTKRKISEEIIYDLHEESIMERTDCPLKDCSDHVQIAQLILWKEDGQKGENNQHFRVSIVGSSGPATFGLASLFVDEDQKLRKFLIKNEVDSNTSNDNDNNTLLCELQSNVRKKIFQSLMNKLRVEIKSILNDTDKEKGNLDRYISLVLYSVYSYLETVFYRYFFPFLTEKDIQRIHNGIYMFLNSMKVAKQSPFCLDYKAKGESDQCPAISNDGVKKIIDMLPRKITNFLESFKGLEAFYKVVVSDKSGDEYDSENPQDMRVVKKIEMLNDEGGINYFIFPTEESNK